MKIIYSGIHGEYYDPKRAPSFEYTNFYLTLKVMPDVEAIEYPYDTILQLGKSRWNEELLELVKKERPDVLFAFMYTDELDVAVLEKIKSETHTKTIAWFADDYWRFFNYSRHMAPHFTCAVTTSHKALEWYKEAGHKNVLLSQWACNPEVYTRKDVAQDIDVSFIGQYKPARARVIRGLEREGIKVEKFGFGWPRGRVSQEEMLSIVGRSKINLNINARAGLFSPTAIGRTFLKRARNRLVPDFHIIDNLRAYMHFPTPHIHARLFELSGAGGFVMSSYSEGIERYYEDGKEMIFFRTVSELTEKIRYYLSHDDERAAIREAGYARTLREHTYRERFKDIFRACF